MRKFTKCVLTLALLVLAVGSAKAGKYHATFGTEWYCAASWNSGTNTMSWKGVWALPSGGQGTWYFINTGLPNGDITDYTKFHATLSDFTDNVDHVWLRIKQGDNNYADAKLVAGENNIDLKALAEENPSVDFKNITDITIWGAREALAGKTIDGEHSASVVITNVYMQTVKNLVRAGLGDEITSLSSITDGTKFVISDGANAMYFITGDDARNSRSAVIANVPNDSYYYYTLTKVDGLDLDGDSNPEDNLYIVNIVNGDGTAFPNQWGWPNKLNISQYGGIFSARATSTDIPAYGLDYNYGALWKVAYVDDGVYQGFTFQNASTEKPNYLKVAGEQAGVYYLHLYKSLDFTVNSEFDKEDNAANDEIFAIANATGYNEETGVIAANGGWEFATPVDLSDWDYLVIALSNGYSSDVKFSISDDNGNTIAGDDYDKGDVPAMWFSNWNNQTIACLSIDFLRANKNMDISKIKSLKFNGAITPSVVYLTDYANAKLNGRGRYGRYIDGDLKREYTNETVGKFGTICLPYVASYAGAEVYSITGKTTNSITLEKVTGLLDAGKPYFYKSTDVHGQNNAGTVCNVNFFRADLGDDLTVAGTNNGLIGTFVETTAPQGENYYVLSGNKIWEVDSEVTVGANKAYIDMSQVTATAGARGTVTLDFGEATGINDVRSQMEEGRGEFYNLAGQRVEQPTKGLYIVNGKKVIIK